jgi:hypothetical protein
METHISLFLGVIAFLALIQWARGRRSRGKTKSESSDYNSTWSDSSVAPESHHSDSSCHGASADAGSSDFCSSDGGGGGGDSGSF